MLDKTARKMLKYMTDESKVPGGAMMYGPFYDAYGAYSGLPEHQMMACVRFLMQEGCISAAYTTSGKEAGFQVEHKGYQYTFFRRQDIKAYIADKWIDFFSLLTSVSALLISIIALLLTLQG